MCQRRLSATTRADSHTTPLGEGSAIRSPRAGWHEPLPPPRPLPRLVVVVAIAEQVARAATQGCVCVGGRRGGVVMRCDGWGQGVVREGGSLRQLCVGSRVRTAHVAGRVARAAAALLRSTPRGHMAQRTGCRGGMRGGVAERGDPRASRTPGAPRRARTRGPHGAATRGGAFPPAGKKKNASPALDRPATATAAAAPADAHTVAGITVLPPARAAAEPSPAPGPACAQQRLPLPPACPRASAWAR